MKEYNRKYDEAQASGESCDPVMKDAVKMMFYQAMTHTSSLGYEKFPKQIAAAQVITDMIMKEYSAARYNKDMSKYADGYILKNVQENRDSFMSASQEEIDEAIKEYNKLKAIENEKVNDTSHKDFINDLKSHVEMNVNTDNNKSPFVSEEKKNEPVIEINQT